MGRLLSAAFLILLGVMIILAPVIAMWGLWNLLAPGTMLERTLVFILIAVIGTPLSIGLWALGAYLIYVAIDNY